MIRIVDDTDARAPVSADPAGAGGLAGAAANGRGGRSASQGPDPWPPVLGPADRTSFFQEQKKRRRQTRRYVALAAVAAALLGIPFSMLLTPLVYLLLAAALRVAGTMAAVPHELASGLRDIAGYVPGFFSTGAGSAAGAAGGPTAAALAIVALLAPGMIASVWIWWRLLGLFEEAGTGAMLLRLGAREPRAADLEERQLANVIEEMAIAGGLPPPAVRLIDDDRPNAAVVGATTEHATVIVTRGLLNRLDRAETQAVIGHLVASAGNGDLRIALAITTLFQSVELVFTTFEAAFNLSRSAMRELARFARWALSPASRRDAHASADIARMLDRPIASVRDDGIAGLQQDAMSARPRTRLGRAAKSFPPLLIVLTPLILLHIVFLFVRFQMWLVRALVIGPLLMLAFRSRRYLADAAAVQLTRDPDALARALERLVEEGAVVPGGQWFSHLFIVGPEAAAERRATEHRARMIELRRRSFREAYAEVRRHGDEAATTGQGTWAQELGGAASHPKVGRRLKRIARMGARMRQGGLLSRQAAARAGEDAAAAGAPVHHRVAGYGAAVLLLPLIALAGYMLVVVIAMVMGLALFFSLLYMNAAFAIVRLLLL